jgi:hypothetical protein
MADKHRAAPADDRKSRMMLPAASGIFAATAGEVELHSLRSARSAITRRL